MYARLTALFYRARKVAFGVTQERGHGGRVFFLLLALGAVALAGGTPSMAQSYESQESPSDPSTRQFDDPTQDGSSARLPSWAEPSSPEYSQDGGVASEKQATTNAPALPSKPNQVPVDGGAALLALAGAGYAIRKLHDGDDEE